MSNSHPPFLPNLDLSHVLSVAQAAAKEATVAAQEAARALCEARKVATEQAVIRTKLEEHLRWCVETREIDRRARESDREDDRRAREDDRRAADEWRKSFGRKFDYATSAIIALLFGVVGFLLTHGAVKFGGG
jgi:hypothetical protein